jgi:hypothetical protein
MPLQTIVLKDWLGFAGIAAAMVPVLSREQQFAEKLHAYATPRDSEHPNSRVKDLVDMVLLLKDGTFDPAYTLDTLISVFRRRGQPRLPTALGDPPVRGQPRSLPWPTNAAFQQTWKRHVRT